jgi:putative transposase
MFLLLDHMENQAQGPGEGQAQGPAPTGGLLSLGDVVGRFKSFTTKQYISGVNDQRYPPFNKRLWQRNYYEHIVRNDMELSSLREYIINNPIKWEIDKENPIVDQVGIS